MTETIDGRAAVVRERIAAMRAETEALAAQSAVIQDRILNADLRAALSPDLTAAEQAETVRALLAGSRR